MTLRPAATVGGLCLALGIATSLIVAEGIAWMRVPINSYRGEVVAVEPLPRPVVMGAQTATEIWWTFDDQRRFGERAMLLSVSPAVGPWTAPVTGRPSVGAPFDAFFGREYLPIGADRKRFSPNMSVVRAYGWPLACVWEAESVDGMNNALTRWPWNGFSYGGVRISSSLPNGHFLPLLPVWPGLAVDTVVFAAAWFGAIMLAGRVRRMRRRSRGLCDACGYDRRGIADGAACPECGATSVR
jgi:hypothetical protein